jgi:hypothetical protein
MAEQWHVNDLRAVKMRELGWTGPSIDTILIVNRSPAEIARAENGDACVVARISLENRPEELGEDHLADAHLIAAAPSMAKALRDILDIDVSVKPTDSYEERTEIFFNFVVIARIFAQEALDKATGGSNG